MEETRLSMNVRTQYFTAPESEHPLLNDAFSGLDLPFTIGCGILF